MSLVCWVPLIGNTDQQGLSSITMSGSPNSWVDGKLGKCAHFAGSTANVIYNNTTDFNFTDNFSYCCWLKQNFTSGAQYAFTVGRADAGGYGYGIAIASATQITTIFGTRRVAVACAANEWHHVAVTVGDGKVKSYVDGSLVNTSDVATVPTYSDGNGLGLGCFHYSGNIYPYYGDLQDFRIYDHCLSALEVEVLARGLMIHYPLSDTYVEDTTNNTPSGDCLSNTCYNGATGKYGYGTNTDMYKDVGIYEGRYCTRLYMGTSGQSARPYPYVANLFVSQGGSQQEWKTLSFDFFCSIGTYINPYKLGSGNSDCTWTNSLIGSGSFTNAGNIPVVAGKWQHISMTLHGTTSANAEWGYIVMGDTHTSNTSYSWLFANMQLEYKDHETGYTEGGTTRSDRITYDTSGYGYNGTNSASLTVSTDTPRYTHSTHFTAASTNYITIPAVTVDMKNITFAAWGKFDTTSNWMRIFDFGEKASGGGYGIIISNGASGSGGKGLTLVIVGSGGTSLLNQVVYTITTGVWFHVAVTILDSSVKVYVNGNLEKTYTVTALNTATPLNLNYIGKSNWSDPYLEGNVSDFRLYATALSAEDIQKLYNTSASIANNGVLMSYEFAET